MCIITQCTEISNPHTITCRTALNFFFFFFFSCCCDHNVLLKVWSLKANCQATEGCAEDQKRTRPTSKPMDEAASSLMIVASR